MSALTPEQEARLDEIIRLLRVLADTADRLLQNSDGAYLSIPDGEVDRD